MIMPERIWILKQVLVLAVLATGTTHADQIPEGYRQVAQQYAIPPAVFYAIAKTESAKRIKRGIYRPWPWTLNVAGRPARFPTRKEAFAALIRYLKHGITSIDIGLMQVNWRYHRQKLGSAWDALEPYHNLRVGARILRDEYDSRGNWLAAIGAYHSPGKKKAQRQRAKRYRNRVSRKIASID